MTDEPNSGDAGQVEGLVERITYHDPNGPYTVARVRSGGRSVTVVGEMEAPSLGGNFRFVGKWVQHAEYGRQLQVHWYEVALPSHARGIERYLASGVVKGIKKGLAKKIVAKFGDDTMRIIEEEPARLAEVKGLTSAVRAQLVQSMEDHRATRRIMTFLAEFGITPALAGKIHRQYGANSIDVIQHNPYRMADDIYGVGFRMADAAARQMGMASDAPFRLEGGLQHALKEAQDNGHLYLPPATLLAQAAALLDVPPEALEEPLLRLRAAAKVVVETEPGADFMEGLANDITGAVYLKHLYRLEVAVAEMVFARLGLKGRDTPGDEQIAAIESELKIELAAQQKECLRQSLTAGVFIMTGGPGTGKTTTVKSLLAWCSSQGLEVLLAAPTGRAARRMSEACNCEARTIHRLLEFSPGENGFKRNEQDPLEADVVIVDEVSMVDAWLFRNLLAALPPEAQLVLVGDVDQLPSVGAGCVLRDLIESGQVPTVFLNQIFRQGENSLIVSNAHRINAGDMPMRGTAEGDFFFIQENEPDKIAAQVMSLCATRLPRHYGFDPIRDVQVIAPMYRGTAGVTNLNLALQQEINPQPADAPSVKLSNGQGRRGDKVMQMRNNYDKAVFNGDMGVISAIDTEDEKLWVRLLGATSDVEYDHDEAGELALAYACSVHKSQGSEFPAVVIPLTTQHFVMLQRNLLYTAVTRARRLVVLVGAPRALAVAVKNDKVEKRFTRLAQRLRHLAETSEPQPLREPVLFD